MSDSPSRTVPTVPDITLGSRGSTPAHDPIGQRLQAEGEWEALADHLVERMEAEADQRHTIAHQLAEVFEHRLDAPDKAADVFLWVLEMTPGDADALRELERLRGEAEDWEGLIAAYHLGLTATTDLFEQMDLLKKVRMIQHEALADTDGERATCLEAMALHPRCDWAWDALVASHAGDQSWWTLVQELTQVAIRTGELSKGASTGNVGMITLRLAMVMDEHLDQADKAIALYEAALKEGANPLDALQGLEALYADTEDWSGLARTYERLVAHTLAPAKLSELRHNWAMVLADGLGEIAQAITIYDALLADTPDDQTALEAREALLARAV